jgi:hypothetical protein
LVPGQRRGFEAGAAEAVGELLLKGGTHGWIESDLITPAARAAAPELDAAALAGFRNRDHGAATRHI